jgi:ribosomal protein L1
MRQKAEKHRQMKTGSSASERKLDELVYRMREMKHIMRQVVGALNLSINMEYAQMQELDDLRREVNETRGDYNSAKIMIAGFSQKLDELAAAGNDAATLKAGIKEMATELNAMQEDFAAAVTSKPTPGEGGGPLPSGGGAGANE